MNFKKILILIFFLYILIIFQTSFLVHFDILGFIPNFIIIFIALLSLFEKNKKFLSLSGLSSIIGGFFLDLFSFRLFGFYILILSLITIFIKKIIKNYVEISF